MDLEKSNSQTLYIKIPLSALSHGELEDADHVSSNYKFIDGYPSDTLEKKHYVTSYNKETKNAEWVYEILNERTLARNHIGLGLGKFMQIGDDQQELQQVPTLFFKVIIVENDDGTVEVPVCYLIPNEEYILSFFKEFKEDEQMKNEEILNTSFKATLEHIETLSGLKFTAESCKNGEKDSIKTVEWKGEGGNGELTTAAINVRISTPHT
ncbi:uncharacterized protein LOC130106301 [Rhinichthys klamathensis goyatoka]|uniref:uncharacterized protein LOC130106301 n=1 Tax=Rhinichthys klamathensis goyatoka TaxID=3034132 RepID=UPI0024B5E19B|nr:uncharacterized protein LOC130106301 [Rhinichthys klamathensis goyatoka]